MKVTTEKDGKHVIVYVDGRRAGSVVQYDANTWNGHVDAGQFFCSTRAEAIDEIVAYRLAEPGVR